MLVNVMKVTNILTNFQTFWTFLLNLMMFFFCFYNIDKIHYILKLNKKLDIIRFIIGIKIFNT
jgi:hypothetical protein